MKLVSIALAALLLLCLSSLAWADVFNMGPGLTNMQFVTVGDPGNADDMRIRSDGTSGYGGVSYVYNIGTYEVTAAHYCDFLNHKAKSDPHALYSTTMSSYPWACNIVRSGSAGSYSYSVAADFANRPVNNVTFWSACRFANWLSNCQGNGDTETGSYMLSGIGDDSRAIIRSSVWKYAITSEDEWYKAAYYKSGGTNAGYWNYATQSDEIPSNDVTNPDGGNNANFNQDGYSIGFRYYRTNVGEFENSESAYGTFDQGGNVDEWNESRPDPRYFERGRLGGNYGGSVSLLSASARVNGYSPSGVGDVLGFRLVQAVPEPSSLLALSAGGLGLLLGWRRRRG